MFEFLSEVEREVFIQFPFISKFFQGKLGQSGFMDKLRFHRGELLKAGLQEDQYYQLLRMADADSEFNRQHGLDRFQRFCRRMGLEAATPADKINWIKRTNVETFLNILSVSNGLLRNALRFVHWKDKGPGGFVGYGEMIDIDPPKNADQEFSAFYALMQKEISLSTLKPWAAKLYYAIIFAHLFPNGNGRLARTSYLILAGTGLPSSEKIKKHIYAKETDLSVTSTFFLFREEGIPVKKLVEVQDHVAMADDFFGDAGDMSHLKYLAARRVLKTHNSGSSEAKQIAYGAWKKEMQAELKIEYEKLKKKWWWGILDVIDKYGEEFIEQLDKKLLL